MFLVLFFFFFFFIALLVFCVLSWDFYLDCFEKHYSFCFKKKKELGECGYLGSSCTCVMPPQFSMLPHKAVQLESIEGAVKKHWRRVVEENWAVVARTCMVVVLC